MMIGEDFLWLFILGPALVFVLTVAMIRMRRLMKLPLQPQKVCFLAGMLFGTTLIIAYAVTFRFQSGVEYFSGLIYCFGYAFCLNFLNWFLFTVTEISMHIHLLVEIVESGGIRQKSLQERYNKQVVLGVRIPRLLELGQIRLVDGRYVLCGHWVLLGGRMCTVLRKIVGLPPEPMQENDQG